MVIGARPVMRCTSPVTGSAMPPRVLEYSQVVTRAYMNFDLRHWRSGFKMLSNNRIKGPTSILDNM